MKKLIVAAVAITLLSGCATTMYPPPGMSQSAVNRAWMECEFEADKYGHVDMWGTGVGAGLEEGLRKNKLKKQCLMLKGFTASR